MSDAVTGRDVKDFHRWETLWHEGLESAVAGLCLELVPVPQRREDAPYALMLQEQYAEAWACFGLFVAPLSVSALVKLAQMAGRVEVDIRDLEARAVERLVDAHLSLPEPDEGYSRYWLDWSHEAGVRIRVLRDQEATRRFDVDLREYDEARHARRKRLTLEVHGGEGI